jgi:ABC-2 type transport system ATP-binding protein
VIEIKGISKCFGKKTVLTNINMKVETGDLMCLLGPSGSGKTTLIRLIIGAIKGEAGQVLVDEVRIPNMKAIRRIGFMPQNEAIYLDITGRDNLIFFGGLMGLKGAALKEAVDKMLALVKLTEDADKLVMFYSGGMKKRLSLAVALLHDPDILVLDEPTVGIDPLLRKAIWAEFERLQKKGKTILISTHVMDEAEKCKHAALIYNGRLIAYGEVEKLKESTKSSSLEELFLLEKGEEIYE